ncbi:MAG: hypothetical protein JNL45_16925 [Hyphomicrobium sp.]|jgi:hypothetical protein|nr:hypothetical protein [Hyphomicrobium sp.]
MQIHDLGLRQNGRVMKLAKQQDAADAEAWSRALSPQAHAAERAAVPERGNGTEQKLTQLMLAQTLRMIMPREQTSSSGLAADTWRDFLADHVAEAVAPALNVLPSGATRGSSSIGGAAK